MAQTTGKEPKDLTLLDEITISFISKSKKRKLSTIANIDIFSETLMPLVRPIDAPSKSKWLGGSVSILYSFTCTYDTKKIPTLIVPIFQVIDAYIEIIKDMQSDQPRGNGIALLESEAHCQIWKTNGSSKGTQSKRYRESRANVAKRYLEHEMVLNLNFTNFISYAHYCGSNADFFPCRFSCH